LDQQQTYSDPAIETTADAITESIHDPKCAEAFFKDAVKAHIRFLLRRSLLQEFWWLDAIKKAMGRNHRHKKSDKPFVVTFSI
jgi:hypothetical protein